jgi:general secretion pathway protein E/type IV pilus assembly protein PilB
MEIGSILLEQGLINSDQLASSQSPLALSGDELLAHLVGSGAVDKFKALETLAREAGVDFVDLNAEEVDLTLLKDFPQKVIYRQILFPIRKEGNTLFVATSEPLDFYPLDEISAATGMMVEPVLAEKSEIAKLIKRRDDRWLDQTEDRGKRHRIAGGTRTRRQRAFRNGAGGQRRSSCERDPVRGD